jgi:hypothetical protein
MPEDTSRFHGPVRLRKASAGDVPKTAEVWGSAWWDGHRGHVPVELALRRDDDYFRLQAVAWTSLTTLAVDAADTVVGLVIVERDELIVSGFLYALAAT